MPAKPKIYPRIKKPTPKMLAEARKLIATRREMRATKNLSERHILEIEAEAAMYKHAMNLSEEMWKHYNEIIAKSKKPRKKIIAARELAAADFQHYNTAHELINSYIKKRMTPKKLNYK